MLTGPELMLLVFLLELCVECVERTAECRCHQCDVLYCDQCFTKV